MTQLPPGQMTWKSSGRDCGLYLRYSTTDAWQPFQDFPHLAKPDPQHVSTGFSTFIALLKDNWETVQNL